MSDKIKFLVFMLILVGFASCWQTQEVKQRIYKAETDMAYIMNDSINLAPKTQYFDEQLAKIEAEIDSLQRERMKIIYKFNKEGMKK